MISQATNSTIRNAYTSSFGELKESKSVKPTVVTQQGDTSKVEKIKESIDSGEYKVNLDALSELIADDLLG
jgi:anti-sigma28 factor (negative regulator of flagellin synthesis)